MRAFCPGHITCFFHPVRTGDLITTGSRGVGIKLAQGTYVTMEERSDDRLVITMDGTSAECPVTELAVRGISDRGFDIIIENDLPVGQGFGMSASGAIASALCAAEFEERPEDDAFIAAHGADIRGGGGLGDVSAIMGRCHFPVRAKAGLPPYGRVIDPGLKGMDITVMVLDGPLDTGSTLSDPDVADKLARYGSECVDSFMDDPSEASLFSLSKRFSKDMGLETESMKDALSKLRTEGNAGMCMLGHSIFTDLKIGKVRELLGDVSAYQCSSTDSMPRIIRRE